MSKGQTTRTRIVETALSQACRGGVSALTIGSLAGELGMSKSGLFAHFGSKEALQLDVVERAFESFASTVARPALALPPGKAQMAALLERWIGWSYEPAHPGGCPLLGAIFDFDGQPGEIRALLANGMRRWRGTLIDAAIAARSADLGEHADPVMLADLMFGLYLTQHINHWLLDDADAGSKALRHFALMLEAFGPCGASG